MLCLAITAACIFSSSIVRSQDNTVSNVAGSLSGAPGFLDNVVDTSALLNIIAGITGDPAGNLYVFDLGNKRIRKINAVTRMATTVAGTSIAGFSGDGGPAVLSRISDLGVGRQGICTDSGGNVYFSDFGNNRIRKNEAISRADVFVLYVQVA